MIAFLPTPSPEPAPTGDARSWRTVLLVSAAVAAFASTQPWIRVQFTRLFGHVNGPPGWHSTAGFSCLCTCLLVAILSLSETSSSATREASRPASLLLVAISALALAFEWWQGPGHLGGVSAIWTYAFWLLSASLPALLLACTLRCAALSPGPARS